MIQLDNFRFWTEASLATLMCLRPPRPNVAMPPTTKRTQKVYNKADQKGIMFQTIAKICDLEVFWLERFLETSKTHIFVAVEATIFYGITLCYFSLWSKMW